jgi:hypothetical protein
MESKLPILGFKYGEMYIPGQTASVWVGPLICRYTSTLIGSKVTCQNLKTHNEPSGFYIDGLFKSEYVHTGCPITRGSLRIG